MRLSLCSQGLPTWESRSMTVTNYSYLTYSNRLNRQRMPSTLKYLSQCLTGNSFTSYTQTSCSMKSIGSCLLTWRLPSSTEMSSSVLSRWDAASCSAWDSYSVSCSRQSCLGSWTNFWLSECSRRTRLKASLQRKWGKRRTPLVMINKLWSKNAKRSLKAERSCPRTGVALLASTTLTYVCASFSRAVAGLQTLASPLAREGGLSTELWT